MLNIAEAERKDWPVRSLFQRNNRSAFKCNRYTPTKFINITSTLMSLCIVLVKMYYALFCNQLQSLTTPYLTMSVKKLPTIPAYNYLKTDFRSY